VRRPETSLNERKEMKKIKLEANSKGCAALVKELVEPTMGFTTGKILIEFDYTCDKIADEVYPDIQELCPWTLLHILMDKVNQQTKDSFAKIIGDIMAMSDKQREVIRNSTKKSTERIIEELNLKVMRTRKGKCRIVVDGEAEVS
jgi:hypothetical protein